MPIETKKVLWTIFSVGIVLVVFFGLALLMFYPKEGTENAPASVGNITPPRTEEPDIGALEIPSVNQTILLPSPIIIYGEKPKPESLTQTLPSIDMVKPDIKPSIPTLKPDIKQGTPTTKILETPAVTKPVTVIPEKPVVAKKPQKVFIDQYWIQAASFSTLDSAEQLKNNLEKKGLFSVISLKEIDGTKYYRVRIGPYQQKIEAEGWLSRLKIQNECAEAYITSTRVEVLK